ncbi:SdrD B-like domain-containing protein, partial [Psychroserpens sp.]|uniref:SdrD B-like domain-containing protein n=1 Tax=Psychroserpens sp. TaxID=2020870 RepID=UPI0038584701
MKKNYPQKLRSRFAVLLFFVSLISAWAQTGNTTQSDCGSIDGLYIYDQSTDSSVLGPIHDNAQINIDNLPSSYYLVVQTIGNIESVSLNVDANSLTENVVPYTFPGDGQNGNNWNASLGSHHVSAIAFIQDNAAGTHCDSIDLSFTLFSNNQNPNVIYPPANPTCDSGAFLWENHIDVTNLSGSYGIPQADLRFIDGQTTRFTIPGPYPSEFNNAVTVSLSEVVSWDGYQNRVNITQTNEKWKVVFKKNGNIVFESSYTEDTPDNMASGEWIGALESDIFLPQGTDEIIIVHIEDSVFGEGSIYPSANSVVPSSICISYESEVEEIMPPTNPTCDAGAFLWENEVNISSNGNVTTNLRFIDGQTTQFTIPGPYPSEFNSAVTVSLNEVVSWDGYLNRVNVTQTNEKWKVVFKKNGNIVFESSYTEDVEDNVVSGEWIGALESDIFLPQGTDEIIIVHIEDSQLGDGSFPSANSVVPTSICIAYEAEEIVPPTNPTCDAGAFLWENEVDISSNGNVSTDLRFIDGQTTQFTIPGPYPTEFNNAVTVSINEVISWDGYLNRVNVTQTNEKWKLVFKKNGNIIFESSYTEDVEDNVVSGEWIGALESNVFLPQGTDEIIIVHIEDPQLGDGSFPSANSVVPTSICISYEIQTASLGDTVFLDIDLDGIQDPGEEGVEGVTVLLLDCDGNELDSTETDENGNYLFTDLDPNIDYIVEFVTPNGFEVSPANQGGDDANDSDAGEDGQTECIDLEPGEENLTVDAGIYDPVNVGDTVFFDVDRDGIQDLGEAGVEGVTVQLLDEDGNVVDEVTTDENGNYLFENVIPGEYVIMFVEGTLPDDYEFTTANAGGDDAIDSDAGDLGKTEPFTVIAGQDDDLTYDAGIILPTASLGDTVFLDNDQDGIQDPGEEGVEGVTVLLLDCDGNELDATETDENGNYLFTDLDPNID